jgi:tripartite ATP-independent transporter DctP family solute receptor
MLRNNKRIWGIVLSLCVFILVSTNGVCEAKKLSIRLAFVTPIGSMWGKHMQAFKSLVERNLPGQVEIKLYPSAQLGKNQLEMIRIGTVDMCLLGSEAMPLDPRLGVFELPWLFKDYAHVMRVESGPINEEIKELFAKGGIKVLSIHDSGFRQILNGVRPIVTPAHAQGLKLRTGQSPWRIKLFKAIGSSPVPLAGPEIYSALQQGVIDGMESTVNYMVSARLYEVSKFLSLSNHISNPLFLSANMKYWDGLPDKVKKGLQKSAEESIAKGAEIYQREEGKSIEAIKKHVKVNEIDLNKFRESVAPLYKEYKSKFGSKWPDFIKQEE